ncbi:hypothetical protein [Bordetella hinzii]|uniref:hypothetical protein n=1 Tax=Bordetella hinzii TaxID=103855 RepID=UPI0007648536|nr:hypothetical protein [Bordetella hinzii]KXA71082.1 hypothetical protein AXA74_20480 [Bordetella hinzii LMG 13501]VEH23191.1 Uncharacterised protein [Bordetella hinzii]VEH33580.1 Uncharacterised protein [Bordetella hinzii]
MTPQALFYESLTDALRAIIAAAGGTKAVAGQLWPEKTPDAAHRYLLDCLNEARSEKLSPEQVLWLLTLGRKVGCHAGMNFLAREAGYADPAPIEPEDERARLQREYVEAVKGLNRLADRMERLGLGDAR